MIKEVTYYDIICDRCGKSLTEESETCYPDTDSGLLVARQSGWKDIGNKHYCPNCCLLDEETDEYVPKQGNELSSAIKSQQAGRCMADIIYFGTDCCPGHYPKGIDQLLTESEYRYWCNIDNDRWIALITKNPGYGHLCQDGIIAYTYYAFPWSVDDRRGGCHTDLFWRGDHSEEEIISLIKNNPFLARQFRMG